MSCNTRAYHTPPTHNFPQKLSCILMSSSASSTKPHGQPTTEQVVNSYLSITNTSNIPAARAALQTANGDLDVSHQPLMLLLLPLNLLSAYQRLLLRPFLTLLQPPLANQQHMVLSQSTTRSSQRPCSPIKVTMPEVLGEPTMRLGLEEHPLGWL